MRIEIKKPNVVMFKIYPDKTDDWYQKCLWARITFDLDNWSMSAQSDCGNYSYSWCVETGERNFLQLMAVIDKEYLLSKISSRSCFDAESTKANISEWIREDEDLSTEEMSRILSEVNDISESSDGQCFMAELEDIDGLEIPDLWQCFEYEYPVSAKTFAWIFTELVQPKIKEYLKEMSLEP